MCVCVRENDMNRNIVGYTFDDNKANNFGEKMPLVSILKPDKNRNIPLQIVSRLFDFVE